MVGGGDENEGMMMMNNLRLECHRPTSAKKVR
jgi:hypothetical protein